MLNEINEKLNSKVVFQPRFTKAFIFHLFECNLFETMGASIISSICMFIAAWQGGIYFFNSFFFLSIIISAKMVRNIN